MSDYRWTVRNVDHEAIQLLRSVQQDNPEFTLGELLSDAIRYWYENLDEEIPDDAFIAAKPVE
jgi:hypothetical protein